MDWQAGLGLFGAGKGDNAMARIKSSAFANNRLSAVTLPAGLTSIEPHAFADNELTEIAVPAGVTEIGNFAFSGNKLNSVIIPGSLTKIGCSASIDLSLTHRSFKIYLINWKTSTGQTQTLPKTC